MFGTFHVQYQRTIAAAFGQMFGRTNVRFCSPPERLSLTGFSGLMSCRGYAPFSEADGDEFLFFEVLQVTIQSA
jgi:hypothetical protein